MRNKINQKRKIHVNFKLVILLIVIYYLFFPINTYAKKINKKQKSDIFNNSLLIKEESQILKIVKKNLYKDNLIKEKIKKNSLVRWVFLDIRNAAISALKKNLSILQSQVDKDISDDAIIEAYAVFDPLLNFNAAYSKSHYYKRTENIEKYKDATEPNPNLTPPDPSPVYTLYPDYSLVEYIEFDKERPAGFYNVTVDATEDKIAVPTEKSTFGLSIAQKIPWGLSLDISLNAIKQESYWMNYEESWGSYERPWKSTFTESLSVPLPFCKNFGQYSTNDVNIEIKKSNNKRAQWNVQAVINDTLLATDISYWDLVRSVLTLDARYRYYNLLESLTKNTKDLYNQREATDYDIWQAEIGLSNAKQEKELAETRLVESSNTLINIINLESNVIILPIGFKKLLNKDNSNLDKSIFSKDISKNPRYLKQIINVKLSELVLNKNQIQTRPNINFNQSLSMGQTSSAYGYKAFDKALGNAIESPDSLSHNLQLAYNYPLLNRAVGAAYESAKLNKQKEDILKKQIRNSILKEVNNAQADLYASISRVNINKNNYKLSKLAFNEAYELRKNNEITQQELIKKSTTMLLAELSYIDSLINQEINKARIYAALGQLPGQFAKLTAQNVIEQDRLNYLNKKNLLSYFGEKKL